MSNSGWNRPSSTRPPVQKKPSVLRGIVAGIVVVLFALAGAWYFLGDSLTSTEPKAKKTKTIKEVKPVKPEVRTKTNVAVRVAKPRTVNEALENLEVAVRPVKLKRIATPLDLSKYTNRVFSTGIEQIMSWIFTTEPGDLPPPLPEISEDEMNNLVGILLSKSEIKDTDSDAVAACKDAVNRAKKEMSKFIKEGGSPDEFLKYYQDVLCRACEFRDEAANQYGLLAEEDKELANDFLKKVNEKLESEGIKKIEVEDYE